MAENSKITILLADEDSLRRDGLAAVLEGTSRFQIVAQCAEGKSAMESIRGLRPHVAIVDLNLPNVHGIELIRRVRAESLGTRIVIMSGTTDDDIIREVVRAGGDGYLLKNGPARHLVDAISYVRDGGQYFSPQLRRDGLDRHLLEEPPRVPPPRTQAAARVEEPAENARQAARYRDREAAPDEDRDFHASGEDISSEERASEDARYRRTIRPSASRPSSASRSRNRPVHRSSDPQRFRERLREEADGNLEDRDYEILGLMADGIKPILDRLDDIENRVVGMEEGEVPVPNDVQGWFNSQMAETFREGRPGGEVSLGRTVQDLEARLPKLIEEAVTTRFHQMAGKLQEEIEETHIRTLETFVKNIQVKLVQRVSALETDLTKQAEAMQQLREYSQRTEDNLGRLISGVDRLAQELPRRIAASDAGGQHAGALPPPDVRAARRRHSRTFSPKLFWAVVGALALVAAVTVGLMRMNRGSAGPRGAAPSSSETLTKPTELNGNSDTKTKLQAAQEYSDRKDYATAEDIYKQVLKAEPANVDAMKALASVLYREDKIEESAAILEKLPKN
jgi:DNA-binding NarL/FixJ family response regulator